MRGRVSKLTFTKALAHLPTYTRMGLGSEAGLADDAVTRQAKTQVEMR